MRVCVLTNILPPYRIEFYNELAQLCDLHVVIDAVMTPDRNWTVDVGSLRFKCIVADSKHTEILRAGVQYAAERRYFGLSERTLPLLRKISPDIVVSLELGPRTVQAAIYTRLRKIPLICFWEGTPHTEAHASWVRRRIRPWLASLAHAFWVNGKESAAYAESLGVSAKNIFPGMTGIDTTFFRTESERLRPERMNERNLLGLRGTVLVFSGSFSPRKGIVPYLNALTKLRELRPNAEFSLLYIGEGPLRTDIEQWASAHPDVPVVITGFVQMNALPRLYTCGDWFVLPTLEDCWPLATLEPLVCGLPQVFSVYNGATADLLGWNGTGIPANPLDADAFGRTLAQTVDEFPLRLSDMIVQVIANYYSPRQQAQRAIESLFTVLDEHRGHRTIRTSQLRASANYASTSKNCDRH